MEAAKEGQMQGFAWAEHNLGVPTPHDLQTRGGNVFFAPNVSPQTRVVDLGRGAVRQCQASQPSPTTGYYAAADALPRYAQAHGLALSETHGQASTAPYGAGEAGDPLRRGEGEDVTTLDEAQQVAQQHGHAMVEVDASASDRVQAFACQREKCRASIAYCAFDNVLRGHRGLAQPCPWQG
jgi:hypothetical protein